VTTLVNYGYLEWMSESQKYILGIELANLGYKVIRRMDLRREALPFMKKKWFKNGTRLAISAFLIRAERSI
jgi:DNA-binding IclR family transcriptional regulator